MRADSKGCRLAGCDISCHCLRLLGTLPVQFREHRALGTPAGQATQPSDVLQGRHPEGFR